MRNTQRERDGSGKEIAERGGKESEILTTPNLLCKESPHFNFYSIHSFLFLTHGHTAFYRAALFSHNCRYSGKTRVLWALLAAKANINVKDNAGKTALDYVAENAKTFKKTRNKQRAKETLEHSKIFQTLLDWNAQCSYTRTSMLNSKCSVCGTAKKSLAHFRALRMIINDFF